MVTTRRMIHGVCCMLAAWLPTLAFAQTTVRGVVRDSLSGRPFGGATVQLVSAITPWDSGFTTRSDSSGHFRISQVPAGRYLFGFQHPRLDSLGMDAVTRAIEIPATQSRITADLALPAARTLAMSFCGVQRDDVGAFIGRVFTATDGAAISRGGVVVRWDEVRVGSTGVRAERAQLSASVGDDGRFVLCDVPTDVPLLVQAVTGGIGDPPWTPNREVSGEIELAFGYDTPLLHRDLYVAPHDRGIVAAATPITRSGRVTGRIVSDDDRPVAGARVSVPETTIAGVSDSAGAFRLAGLPLGTHAIAVVALGFEPMKGSVDVRPNVDAPVTVRARKILPTLDEVVVQADRDLSGFNRRRKLYAGSFLTATDIARKGAFSVGEALIGVPSLQYGGVDSVTGKPVILGRSKCSPSFYLDGVRQQEGLRDIDSILGITHIGGIEVYANPSEAPPQYSGPVYDTKGGATRIMAGGCATVVVWTKSQVR